MKALHSRCHGVTARHAASLVAVLAGHGGLLTEAATAVLGCSNVPGGLVWGRAPAPAEATQAGGHAAAFEALCPKGHLFSINVLDGTLLLDGFPPSRLPLEVREG